MNRWWYFSSEIARKKMEGGGSEKWMGRLSFLESSIRRIGRGRAGQKLEGICRSVVRAGCLTKRQRSLSLAPRWTRGGRYERRGISIPRSRLITLYKDRFSRERGLSISTYELIDRDQEMAGTAGYLVACKNPPPPRIIRIEITLLSSPHNHRQSIFP